MIERKSSFLDNFPRLKAEWYYEENEKSGIYPENLSFGSRKKVFWKCETGNKCHIWEASINSRKSKKNITGCPFCSVPVKKICPCGCNSVWASNPELREQWDEKKNGSMKLYTSGSDKKVFWKCEKSKCHIWEARINNRTNKENPKRCPFCVNQQICPCGCNSLWASSPNLREEWDEEKNGSMKSYFPNSGKKVFWRCKTKNKCHVWQTVINYRTNKKEPSGCPFCVNQQICPCGCNSLWASSPNLREEWDEEKNGSMKLYSPNSRKKVFWKCKTKNKFHVWEARIYSRTGKTQKGCPFCKKSKLETLVITTCSELKIQYDVQKRYKDCKDVRCLPYDFFLPKYKICVELQGEQHFQSKNFFHRTPANYLKRLITDSKKVKSAYDRCDSFLSISHLVETQEEMTSILKNMIKKVKKDQTIRFQITSEIYFDAFSKLSISIPTNNKLLLVYEIYDEQRKMIEGSFGEGLEYDKKLIRCPYCDEHHLENYIVHHYQTKSHYRTLKKTYENLVGMGKNGVPIVLENNLNLEL
jgi:hypothetical protein